MDGDLTEEEIQEAFSGIFDEAVPNELHLLNLCFATTSEAEIDQHLDCSLSYNSDRLKSCSLQFFYHIYCLRRLHHFI